MIGFKTSSNNNTRKEFILNSDFIYKISNT